MDYSSVSGDMSYLPCFNYSNNSSQNILVCDGCSLSEHEYRAALSAVVESVNTELALADKSVIDLSADSAIREKLEKIKIFDLLSSFRKWDDSLSDIDTFVLLQDILGELGFGSLVNSYFLKEHSNLESIFDKYTFLGDVLSNKEAQELLKATSLLDMSIEIYDNREAVEVFSLENLGTLALKIAIGAVVTAKAPIIMGSAVALVALGSLLEKLDFRAFLGDYSSKLVSSTISSIPGLIIVSSFITQFYSMAQIIPAVETPVLSGAFKFLNSILPMAAALGLNQEIPIVWNDVMRLTYHTARAAEVDLGVDLKNYLVPETHDLLAKTGRYVSKKLAISLGEAIFYQGIAKMLPTYSGLLREKAIADSAIFFAGTLARNMVYSWNSEEVGNKATSEIMLASSLHAGASLGTRVISESLFEAIFGYPLSGIDRDDSWAILAFAVNKGIVKSLLKLASKAAFDISHNLGNGTARDGASNVEIEVIAPSSGSLKESYDGRGGYRLNNDASDFFNNPNYLYHNVSNIGHGRDALTENRLVVYGELSEEKQESSWDIIGACKTASCLRFYGGQQLIVYKDLSAETQEKRWQNLESCKFLSYLNINKAPQAAYIMVSNENYKQEWQGIKNCNPLSSSGISEGWQSFSRCLSDDSMKKIWEAMGDCKLSVL